MHNSLQSSDNVPDSPSRARRSRVLAWIAPVFLAGLLAACGPAKDPGPTETAIGQSLKLGDQEFTVWSVSAHSYVGQPSQPVRAKDGEVLIAVRYELRNDGNKPLTVSTARPLLLIDPSGGPHPGDPALTAAYLSTSELKDNAPTLAAGASAKQVEVFSAPVSSYPRGWAVGIGDKTHRVELQ